jgi:hypothetical protein
MSEPVQHLDRAEKSDMYPEAGVDGNSAVTLRDQAQEIIDEVLKSTDPGLEGVRNQLTLSVSRHPECPERALLEHLMNRQS